MAGKKKNRHEKPKLKTRLKRGDVVVVIAGKAKGQKGEILAIDREKGRVWVKGVNLRKRYERPTQENPKGGVVEREASIHISNVMIYDPKAKKPSRIRMGVNKQGKKVRILVKSGTELDS
ncbi:MAG: 50S ribosomal protein L24 [Leptospiraceae bacterium]|nr:50S ribosomal protein L24 [Leptospiraceae bacterium]MDW8306071.1 50S ribosomal protein L24 [Leptospiraceae bacterium]